MYDVATPDRLDTPLYGWEAVADRGWGILPTPRNRLSLRRGREASSATCREGSAARLVLRQDRVRTPSRSAGTH